MKRVLLKLSGEALAGVKHTGFDEATVVKVAKQVKQLADDGVEVGVVIGGGNFWRGRTSENIDRTKADQIGMLATVMNCIYVSEIFRSEGMKTQVLTPFECGSFTKLFSKDRANKYFEHGMVVFFAGGIGHPYFSTDTTTVLRAVEIEADVILLAKAIDGVYDSDPKVNPNAVRYDEVSIQEVIDKQLAVVDLTASIMCMENHMPMYVFGLNEENSIVKAISGKFNGTVVTVLTPFECGSFTKLFSKDRANKYFEHGMVVFFAGGIGHPYFSTDTTTVLRAVEIEADVILLAKAIDGVYDSDPKVNPNAVRYDEVSIQEVIDKQLAVVDLTASIMCMENHMPMYVFGLNEENSIVKAISGKFNGTVVTV